jgi:hypothetical protein
MPIARFVAAGGLLSYGIGEVKYHRIGTYAGKILRGVPGQVAAIAPMAVIWRPTGARSMHGNQETAFLRDVKISHRHSDHYNEDPFLTSAIFGEGGHLFLDRLNPLFWLSNEIGPLPARFIEF